VIHPRLQAVLDRRQIPRPWSWIRADVSPEVRRTRLGRLVYEWAQSAGMWTRAVAVEFAPNLCTSGRWAGGLLRMGGSATLRWAAMRPQCNFPCDPRALASELALPVDETALESGWSGEAVMLRPSAGKIETGRAGHSELAVWPRVEEKRRSGTSGLLRNAELPTLFPPIVSETVVGPKVPDAP